MDRGLEKVRQAWDALGRSDPLWAILTHPGKRNREWDLGEFFRTGEAEARWALELVATSGLELRRRSALDFGCGVGRITQALVPHFERCFGVDVAPSMLEQANRHNRHPRRCFYLLNPADDLRFFGDGWIDFIYSRLVLQHMGPELSRRYLEEFVRILAPGGIAVFQLPSRTTGGAEEAALPGQSVAAGPLPPAAFSAEIGLDGADLRAPCGSALALPVRVANHSAVPWPSLAGRDGHGLLRLGNHWLDAGGKRLVTDDGRAPLRADLGPGESTEVTLVVTVPTRPGDYLLELDMVQEHVAWFADRGSPTLRRQLHAEAQAGGTVPEPPRRGGLGVSLHRLLRRAAPAAAAELVPAMEMHPVAREHVEAWVQGMDARVVTVVEDRAAGEGWLSYCYVIVK